MIRYTSISVVHVKKTVSVFISWFLVLCALFLLLRCMEMAYDRLLHGRLPAWWNVWLTGIVKDIFFLMGISIWAYLGYFLISLLSKKLADMLLTVTATMLCLVHLVLSQYFLITLTALGADLWDYSAWDIWQTIVATGIKWSVILVLVTIIALAAWSIVKLPRKVKINPALGMVLIVLFAISEGFDLAATANTWRNNSSEYGNSLSINKSYYFYKQSIEHFFPAQTDDADLYAAGAISNDSNNMVYPFLHTDETPDVLSAFIRKSNSKPNIVMVVVEGLGRAYSNEGAYLGSFTPFLDSLARHALYWENFLSEAGRTFAVLPSLLASLPFGKTGFTELDSSMPAHLSLISLLKHNGYETSFYYGGDAQFDNMAVFLQKNAIDHIYDLLSFPTGYSKLPVNGQGFNWGYGDKELFRYYFSTPFSRAPYCNILLTVASHDPFLVNQQDAYLARFEQRMNELAFDDDVKAARRDYKMQFASILYVDDALQEFFNSYAKLPDFNNTIFIITGDHRMPEIPMRDKLDRYHVPLIIFSPLLTRPAKFSAVSTHFDVTPCILQLLKNQYQLQVPLLVAWVGNGLDTAYEFVNRHAYPLMQSKNHMIDFIQGDHMIVGNDLYRINSNMALTPVNDKDKLEQLQRNFKRFKQKNRQVISGAKLLPDSIYRQYFPR